MNISPLKQNMEEFDYAISKFIDRVRDFHNDFDSMPITASMLQTYLHQSLMFKDIPINLEYLDPFNIKSLILDLLFKKSIALSKVIHGDRETIEFQLINNFIFIYGRSLGPSAPPRLTVPINPDLPGPDTITLGVFIHLHGEIKVDSHFEPIQNTNYPDVTIRKQNVAAFSCSSSIFPMYSLDEIHDLVEHTLLDYRFRACINKKQYIQSTRSVEHDFYEFHREQGSCELIEDITNYYEKVYTVEKDSHLIFIKNDDPYGVLKFYRKVDLVDCTKDELYRFFYSPKKTFPVTQLIEDFIQNRTTFTTTQLFNFIKLASETLHISKVNILDTSCNVIPDATTFKLPVSYNWKKTRIGYGGRKSRKSRKINK
jgi:hypothetical protein